MSEKKKVHYDVIDVLKAFSAITVIWIHISNHYKSTPLINTLWIWSHFAVGVFVVSSGFLQGIKPFVFETIPGAVQWLWNRIKRLIIPYFMFLIVYVLLIIVLPGLFDQRSLEWSPEYIFNTLTLHGGFGGNWIPRVFVLLSAMHLLFELFTQKYSYSKYYVPLFVTLIISLAFFINEPDITHKYIQVFTWYPLFLFGLLLYKNYQNKKFIFLSTVATATITLACAWYLSSVGRSTSIFNHKYPPTLYFVAFNSLVALVLFIISPKKLPSIVRPIVTWISRKSYEIFFAHLIVIDGLGNFTESLIVELSVTIAVTLLAVYLWDRFLHLFSLLLKQCPLLSH